MTRFRHRGIGEAAESHYVGRLGHRKETTEPSCPVLCREMTMKATPYKTIKDVVSDIIQRTKGSTDYEAVTEAVRRHFPNSRWKASHWSFYRSQVTSEKGRYRDVFPEEIRANLRRTANPGGRPSDDTVKRIGDKILEKHGSGLNWRQERSPEKGITGPADDW